MNSVATMDLDDIEVAREYEAVLAEYDSFDLTTEHTLHGGIYSRTIVLEKDEVIVGATIKVPTTLFITGHLKIYVGGDDIEIHGTEVIAASKGRKQIMTALDRTSISMCFSTTATTIEEAEHEFTDDSDRLVSRLESSRNLINITGE